MTTRIGMTGMLRHFPSLPRMTLPMLVLVLIVPSLTHAKVSIMKPAAARALIGSDGSQPVSLSVSQWARALGSIRYTKATFFSSASSEPVFSGKQIETLAPQLHQSLAGIKPGQAVTFRQDKIRGAVFFSNDRLYWYISRIDNKPALKLTYLAEEDARTNPVIEAVADEDIDRTYWSLTPGQGQSLQRGRPDLLAMSVGGVPDTTRAATGQTKSAAIKPAAVAAVPAATATGRDAQERIDMLHRLLNKNLITKDEYRGKLGTIIREYETQHPSPEAGLELLHALKQKGQIDADMFQQHRKRLLDRL